MISPLDQTCLLCLEVRNVQLSVSQSITVSYSLELTASSARS